MKKELTEFEKFKVLFNIHNPDEVLKSWINEDNFNNLYTEDWEHLQECFASLDNLMTDNDIFEGISDSDLEQYEHMKENFSLSYLEGNKQNAFEWLYSLADWYLEKLPKVIENNIPVTELLETHYEVVCIIEAELEKDLQVDGVIKTPLLKLYEDKGRGGKWELAQEITLAFHKKYPEWDENYGYWSETLDLFTTEYLRALK